ncbi:ribonuclease HII [Silvanigrella sp.]|jgi:ribonuclease HII|uniref:ribonuclease HII n=1 Tax=Silvanigrella sp. TaxID=2024976 RepID=UPI0037CC3F55|nr:ribonuclease HII [Silvanigrellaceae bacterium]
MNLKTNIFQNEQFLLDTIAKEQKLKTNVPLIISIDEVGRGCVAGPVLSCVSLWTLKGYDPSFKTKSQKWVSYIDDSKKLSEKKRTQCFDLILNDYDYNLSSIPFSKLNPNNLNHLVPSNTKLHYKSDLFINKKNSDHLNDFECIYFSLGEASSQEVDEFNIWNALQLAIARALTNLYYFFKSSSESNIYPNLNQAIILMDGKHFIKVPKEFEKNIQATVTQADGLFISVGFSSIIAKVYRDTFMIYQDSLYPSFGFSGHKGYGTPKHLNIIQNIGICPLHRKSFLTNYYSN